MIQATGSHALGTQSGGRLSPLNSKWSDARRLLAVQAILVCLTGLGFGVALGLAAAQAAVYGGAIALLSAWMLGRRVRRAAQVARDFPGQETIVLYIGVVQRFATVLALFAVGMGWLKLLPVPMLVGFVVAQGAFFLAGTQVEVKRESEK